MKSPVLKAESQKSLHVILIIDKVGIIGEALAREFSRDYLVVFLSAAEIEKTENVIPVKFKKRIPEVPSAKYKKIFLVDDGGTITRESAFSFVKLAREYEAPLFFIGSLRNTDIEHADQIATEYSNSKVLIFGDIFDKKIFFDKDASISRYILEARRLRKIEVPGNGLSLSFPITFDDTIKLILKATTINIVQKVILLFYPHPITDISLANVFQRVDPELMVDFGKGKKESKIYYPKNAVHAISKYDLEKKVKELDLEDREEREVKVINKNRKYKNRIFKPVLFFLLACLFLVLLPFFSTVVYMKLGQWETGNAVASSGRGDFGKAVKQANNSETFFGIAEKTSEPLIAEARIFGMEKEAEKIKDGVVNGKSLSGAVIDMLEGLGVLRNVYIGASINPSEDFTKASNDFKSSLAIVSKLKAEGNLPKDYAEKLKNLEPFTDIFTNSVDILPDILGFEKEKNYLILFENNGDLRPGGGEIDSIADISIKNARITKFEILDPDKIDQEIKLDTDPPFEYRRFMGEKSLVIKDSLNNPDFVKSAITATNLYSKSTGKEVDGVIGVDMDTLKSMLDLVGGVRVDSKDVNSSNLEISAEGQSGYLGKVAEELKKKMDTENASLVNLSVELGRLIQEKHLSFAFKDVAIQNIFTANAWSSSIWDNRKEDDDVINDYLGLSETNLGKNNVNNNISRSVVKKIKIDESGKVSSSMSIFYKNSSSSISYANYLKIILPLGTTVTSVTVDNKNMSVSSMQTDYKVYESVNFKVPTGLEVDSREELGKNIYGLFLGISKSSSKNLIINYDLPSSFNPGEKSAVYSLKIFKQPGTEVLPFNLNFELPPDYQTVGVSSYTGNLKSDTDLEFTISQK